jgi:hypothetical protein
MRNRKPAWWLLYALVPIMVALFVIEHYLVLSELGHKLVQLVIVVVVFGAMALWVRANETSLTSYSKRDSTREELRITEYEPPESDEQGTTEGGAKYRGFSNQRRRERRPTRASHTWRDPR